MKSDRNHEVLKTVLSATLKAIPSFEEENVRE